MMADRAFKLDVTHPQPIQLIPQSSKLTPVPGALARWSPMGELCQRYMAVEAVIREPVSACFACFYATYQASRPPCC